MEVIVDLTAFEKINSISTELIENFIKYIVQKNYNTHDSKDVYISLLLTDNENIRKINKDYRDIDSETDVISFAYDETENEEGFYKVLGDVVISIEKIREQAKEYSNTLGREFFYILAHGILHLLGYDHIDEKDKKIMREEEEVLLKEYDFGDYKYE